MPWSSKVLFTEAVVTSAYVKALLLFFPFRKVMFWLGKADIQNEDVVSRSNEDIIKKIRFAVRLCDKYTPWPTECYTRSLTAKIMLKRRNLSGILYFAFRKDQEGSLKGHSWVKCSGMVVTGFCDFSKYIVHSSFC